MDVHRAAPCCPVCARAVASSSVVTRGRSLECLFRHEPSSGAQHTMPRTRVTQRRERRDPLLLCTSCTSALSSRPSRTLLVSQQQCYEQGDQNESMPGSRPQHSKILTPTPAVPPAYLPACLFSEKNRWWPTMRANQRSRRWSARRVPSSLRSVSRSPPRFPPQNQKLRRRRPVMPP